VLHAGHTPSLEAQIDLPPRFALARLLDMQLARVNVVRSGLSARVSRRAAVRVQVRAYKAAERGMRVFGFLPSCSQQI